MARKTQISQRLQKRAESMIPGGVNSPVRAFQSVGGDAPFIVRGEGSRIFDADGNEYIDYVGSWGPLILGHAAPTVVNAVIGPLVKEQASARRRQPRRTWLNWCSPHSHTCRKCASSAREQKRPCLQFAWPAPIQNANTL